MSHTPVSPMDQQFRLEATRRALIAARSPGQTLYTFAKLYWSVLGWQTPDACRNACKRLLPRISQPFEPVLIGTPETPLEAPGVTEMWRRLKTTERRLDKANAMSDVFAAIAREVLTAFAPVPIPVLPTSHADRLPELAVAVVSDMHVGEFSRKEDMAGLTQFNIQVLYEEIRTWKKNLRDCVAMQRSGVPVPRILVLLGGDFPTGEDIYPKQWAEIDELLMEQITQSGFILADMIRYLSTMFEHVDVLAVDGNHGRTLTTTLSADRLAYIICGMLVKDITHVNFQFTRSPFVAWSEPSVDRPEPWNYLFTHGRDIKGWGGIPYYGIDRARAQWIDLTGMVYDSVILGHHHRYAETAGWIMNGSWVAGSHYSLTKLRAANQATQALLFHSPKIGWTSRWPLYLSPKPRYDRKDVTEMTIHTPVTSVDELLQSFPGDELDIGVAEPPKKAKRKGR